MSIPVISFNAPSVVTGVDVSDQLHYWHFGYEAYMTTDTSLFLKMKSP
jgi:hypothetical protein